MTVFAAMLGSRGDGLAARVDDDHDSPYRRRRRKTRHSSWSCGTTPHAQVPFARQLPELHCAWN
jgi:hypothetical protein